MFKCFVVVCWPVVIVKGFAEVLVLKWVAMVFGCGVGLGDVILWILGGVRVCDIASLLGGLIK